VDQIRLYVCHLLKQIIIIIIIVIIIIFIIIIIIIIIKVLFEDKNICFVLVNATNIN